MQHVFKENTSEGILVASYLEDARQKSFSSDKSNHLRDRTHTRLAEAPWAQVAAPRRWSQQRWPGCKFKSNSRLAQTLSSGSQLSTSFNFHALFQASQSTPTVDTVGLHTSEDTVANSWKTPHKKSMISAHETMAGFAQNHPHFFTDCFYKPLKLAVGCSTVINSASVRVTSTTTCCSVSRAAAWSSTPINASSDEAQTRRARRSGLASTRQPANISMQRDATPGMLCARPTQRFARTCRLENSVPKFCFLSVLLPQRKKKSFCTRASLSRLLTQSGYGNALHASKTRGNCQIRGQIRT